MFPSTFRLLQLCYRERWGALACLTVTAQSGGSSRAWQCKTEQKNNTKPGKEAFIWFVCALNKKNRGENVAARHQTRSAQSKSLTPAVRRCAGRKE